MNSPESTLHPTHHTLAIDASPYAVRAVLVQDGVQLADTVEVKPGQLDRVVRFISTYAQQFPRLRIVGSPLDQWPQGLHVKIEHEAGTPRWLSPNVARETQWCWAPWQLKRRMLRARFLAFLAHEVSPYDYTSNAAYLVLRWEYLMAQELLREALVAAHHAGLNITDPNPDF